jgi:uncharacterized membrane protein
MHASLTFNSIIYIIWHHIITMEIPLLSRLNEIVLQPLPIAVIVIIFYLLYRLYFKGITFKCVGKYDQK